MTGGRREGIFEKEVVAAGGGWDCVLECVGNGGGDFGCDDVSVCSMSRNVSIVSSRCTKRR